MMEYTIEEGRRRFAVVTVNEWINASDLSITDNSEFIGMAKAVEDYLKNGTVPKSEEENEG